MVHRYTCRKDTYTHKINKSKTNNAGSSSAGVGGRVRREDPWGWMASQFPVGYSVPNGTFRCTHKHAHTQRHRTHRHRRKTDRRLGVQWTQGQKWAGPGPVTMVVPAHSRLRDWPVTNDLKLSIECSLRRAILIASLRCRGASGLWGGSCCSPGSSPPVPNPCP